MSIVAETMTARVRVSDPNPAYCVACWQGAREGLRFVDFDAAFDGGQQVEERDGMVINRFSADDLHLCEQCVRSAAEALGLKPELHADQVRTIQRLERERDHWKDYAQRVEAAVSARPEPGKKRGR